MRQWLGSLAFTIFLVVAVAVYASLLFATLPLPGNDPYRWAVGWARAIMRALRRFCGLDWSVSGRDQMEDGPGIVSAETPEEAVTAALAAIARG